MANHQWNLKSNYMLAFTICKYGLHPERWNLVADDLADYIKTTPQNCKIQFDILCQQYGQDWQNQSVEPLHSYIFSIIKRLYYGDLCERMTESRDLLTVMYDFIRLFRGGQITLNDINAILQDVKNTVPTGNNTVDNERQQKIKMLERLRLHIAKQMSQTPDTQHSSFPVELLPPPPFFQQPVITNQIPPEQSMVNDRQVPSMSGHQKSNVTEPSSFPVIIQSNNSLLDNERQFSNNNNNNNNQSNDDDIDEIELSSDDDNDRTAMAHMSAIDEPVTNSNLIDDQDESTFISDEQIETNESSNIPPIPMDVSNSNDRDLYETVSSTSLSNQSTFDTQLSTDDRVTSSLNSQPIPSNLQLNASISGSNDYLRLTQNHHSIENESNITTPSRIPVVDDEVARMDAEQIPEPIPADITDIAVANDNAVFVIDELVSNTTTPTILITTNIDEQSTISENEESIFTKSSRRQSRVTTSSLSTNFRKSINAILNNLKTAKYGPDFAKPLKAFKLPDEYYFRIKKPLDIPEIRERMHNGDYDENILFFERDILLMFTNALSMYHRDLDIHGHAQYMINYAMELLSPIEELLTPWKNENYGDSSGVFPIDHENDSDDNTLNPSSSTRTPSIASTSSSIRVENLRRQATSYHPMPKRQRKTTH